MKAFILAAGVSRRLYPHTYSTPKCLLEVGGKAIIDYQLEALDHLGVNHVIMIVGYHRELLIDYVKKKFPQIKFSFIINHHYFETNTAYSVFLGRRQLLKSDFLLMNADVVYPKKLLIKIFNSSFKTALAVDHKTCGKEEVKVIDGGQNKIVAIGKDLIENQCLGEFIGVAKLSKDFNKLFVDSIEHLIDAGGINDYFEAAIQPILSATDVNHVDISKYPCLEIDFIDDLISARKLFH